MVLFQIILYVFGFCVLLVLTPIVTVNFLKNKELQKHKKLKLLLTPFLLVIAVIMVLTGIDYLVGFFVDLFNGRYTPIFKNGLGEKVIFIYVMSCYIEFLVAIGFYVAFGPTKSERMK